MINSLLLHKIREFNAKIILILAVLSLSFVKSQKKEFWLMDVQTSTKKKVNDSISAVRFLDSLAQNFYYLTRVKDVKKEGEITTIFYDKGLNYNKAQVFLSQEIQEDLSLKKEFYTKNLDSLKKKINSVYSEKGFVFNRVKSKWIGMENSVPKIELSIEKLNQRKIDELVIRGYDKLPKRFIKNLEKEFVGKVFQPKNIERLNTALQNHRYVQLTKVPQSLFRKDSTQIYLFLNKKKVNFFDGVVGFGNDDNDKIAFNGTLDVKFSNLFNGFESVNLYWQRQVDRGQIFNVEVDVPYLFKSNVGTRNTLHIYRQDTIFANVRFQPEFYYSINNRQKVGVRGVFESSSVLDDTYTLADDFSKKGIGLTYEFIEPTEVDLFLHKTYIRASVDWLVTDYDKKNTKNTQRNYYLFVDKNIPIYENHYLNLKGEGAWFESENPLSYNEKLRFGGWNSMRGFNENSLLADYFFYGNLEYRYLINENAFFDSFVQYGQLNNENLAQNINLYSFGLGFNLRLPIGLMSLQISNGSEFSQAIQFKQTKIHWGILTRF